MKTHNKVFNSILGLFLITSAVSLIILFFLPDEIPIKFWFLLTSGATYGSKYNLLALPTITGIGLSAGYVARKYYNKTLNAIFSFLTLLSIIATIYFLIQIALTINL